jgi:hypothetical protein
MEVRFIIVTIRSGAGHTSFDPILFVKLPEYGTAKQNDRFRLGVEWPREVVGRGSKLFLRVSSRPTDCGGGCGENRFHWGMSDDRRDVTHLRK